MLRRLSRLVIRSASGESCWQSDQSVEQEACPKCETHLGRFRADVVRRAVVDLGESRLLMAVLKELLVVTVSNRLAGTLWSGGV